MSLQGGEAGHSTLGEKNKQELTCFQELPREGKQPFASSWLPTLQCSEGDGLRGSFWPKDSHFRTSLPQMGSNVHLPQSAPPGYPCQHPTSPWTGHFSSL